MARRGKKSEGGGIEDEFRLDSLPGVGPTKMGRLNEAGIRYIHDICMVGPEALHRITGTMSVEDTTKLWLNSIKILEDRGVIRPTKMSAMDHYKYKRGLPRLSCGCEAIDLLFGGHGPQQETLTEVYGAFGSGKTQYTMSCMVEVLSRGEAVYMVDCEDTFSVERLLEIAAARGHVDMNDDAAVEEFLAPLTVKTATSSAQTYSILNGMTGDMLRHSVKLVVIDGAIGQIRNEYLDRSELSERQAYMKPLIERLMSMPMYFRCWVIFTNQVQHDPGAMYGDPTKPIGGNIVGHAATHRMYVSKYSERKWGAKMVDSPTDPVLTMPYCLTARGVTDLPEELRKAKASLCKTEAGVIIRNLPAAATMDEIKSAVDTHPRVTRLGIDYAIKDADVREILKELGRSPGKGAGEPADNAGGVDDDDNNSGDDQA